MSDQWFPATDGHSVLGRFRAHKKLDLPKSREKDERVYKEVVILETRVAGYLDTSAVQLKPENRANLIARFPDAWEAFEGKEFKVDPKVFDGLGLTQDQVASLILQGIRSIEQVASLSDGQCQVMGFGWRKIRNNARDLLMNEQGRQVRIGQPEPAPRKPYKPDERAPGMLAAREEGKTLREIGETYGITQERVRQILWKHNKHSQKQAMN